MIKSNKEKNKYQSDNEEQQNEEKQLNEKESGINDTQTVEEKTELQKAEEKIAELEQQLKEQQDRFLRKAAEFENYKRRSENDAMNLLNYAAESFITKLLPVVDDFERSLQHINDVNLPAGQPGNNQAIKEGIKLVYEKLMKVLNDQGIKKMETVGKQFNVDYHDALMQRKDDSVPAHTVVEEIETGYLYRDKVIRHAKVIVSEESSSDNNTQDSNEPSAKGGEK